MHTAFIKCCNATKNVQLIYILLKLSRGLPFVYNDYSIFIDKRFINVQKGKEVHKVDYAAKQCESLVETLSEILNIVTLEPGNKNALKEYMIPDFVVDCVHKEKISRENAARLLKHIIVCQILKIFSTKDFEVVNDKIISVSGLDTNQLAIVPQQLKIDACKPLKQVSRMDQYWSSHLSKNVYT